MQHNGVWLCTNGSYLNVFEQAKQNHTFILNMNGSMPTASMDTQSNEYSGDEHLSKNAASEASHDIFQNGDNRIDVYDDEDDDDLVRFL